MGSIIAMSIWQAVGFHMVIWLSGLQTISPTLYEAADLEGASKWQTFRFVTGLVCEHGGVGFDCHYDAGLWVVCPSRCDDKRWPAG